MPICELCHVESLIPIELNCDHIFCFLCLYHDFSDTVACPSCNILDNNLTIFQMNKIVPVSVSVNRYYIWLYSSNYGNTWWCYQKDCCEKVELIYKDYCLRKQLSNSQLNQNNPITLSVLKKANKKVAAHSLNSDGEFEELDITDNSSDVEFTDLSGLSDLSNSSDSLDLPDANKNQVQKHNQIVSYTVKIHGTEYKLDFDLMKQINVHDAMKKRNIKRIEIPNHLRSSPASDIMQYISTSHMVLGVSGKKF